MDDTRQKANQDQQRQLQDRLQNRERIQTLFARFGGDACRIVWEEYRRHQGLHPVLQRLGLPAASSLDEEFEMVQRFLNEQGPGAFVRRVRPHHHQLDWDLFGPADEEHPMEKSPKPDKTSTQTKRAKHAKSNKTRDEVKPDRHAAPSKHESKSPPSAETRGPCAITPADWFDASGKYIGPERRASVKDRRSGADRRGAIESIPRNKRFGGERRKNKGRRTTDAR
jgi:hypothetical protein